MSKAVSNLQPIINAAEACRQDTRPVVLAMDGMAAAGKTTAAETLSALWGAAVVHMDDFFLPSELRTPERLAMPGGNVHWERFADEVLPFLRDGGFSYRPFLCSSMSYGEAKTVPAAPVIIVEGAYAMHPAFGEYADVTVFFSIDPEEQKRRVLHRGGPKAWEDFRTRWIPMENAYHEAFQTRRRAQIIV